MLAANAQALSAEALPRNVDWGALTLVTNLDGALAAALVNYTFWKTILSTIIMVQRLNGTKQPKHGNRVQTRTVHHCCLSL